MASYGSAVMMGLEGGVLNVKPTTLYLFAKEGCCKGRCAFCQQSTSAQETRISRVDWHPYTIEDIKSGLGGSDGKFQRICIQCSDETAVRERLPALVAEFAGTGVPVSVSTCPISAGLMRTLKEAGTDVLTIPLDCASEELFPSIKGGRMALHMKALNSALEVFGRYKVGSHLIVGLGESEKDLVLLMSRIFRAGIVPALFAFTPLKGTPMEGHGQPDLGSYRRMQLARHLIVNCAAKEEDFGFNSGRTTFRPGKEGLEVAILDGRAFMTSGCRGCNRPYFNERVSGPIYNYAETPGERELRAIRRDLLAP